MPTVLRLTQLMKLSSTPSCRFCALKPGVAAHLIIYSTQENTTRWKITLLIIERNINDNSKVTVKLNSFLTSCFNKT